MTATSRITQAIQSELVKRFLESKPAAELEGDLEAVLSELPADVLELADRLILQELEQRNDGQSNDPESS